LLLYLMNGDHVGAVQRVPATALLTCLLVLGALDATTGLRGAGLAVGLLVALAVAVTLAVALDRHRVTVLGPADRVTLVRCALVCGVAALTADSSGGGPVTGVLVALASVALALDWVDGQVARRTGTASDFGAAFDMEVDAFLVLVLSVEVARSAGAWVLLVGAARYGLLVAAMLAPWLGEPMPPRYWAKVVAATQGVVLVLAAAQVLPVAVTRTALVGALVLLAASFGHQVWWLRRNRGARELAVSRYRASGDRTSRTGRLRSAGGGVLTALAGALVWFGLTAPHRVGDLTPSTFVRLPVEALVLGALVLVLPPRPGRLAAALVGLVLGMLTVLRLLDWAFFETLDRPFDTVADWAYLGPLTGLVVDSVGRPAGVGVLASVGLLAAALLVATPLAVLRLARLMTRRRRASWRAVAALGTAWLVSAALGLSWASAGPVASTSTSAYAAEQVTRVPTEIRDQRAFARATVDDPLADVPADRLLTGLRGKDVLLVFVESYGRVAVQGSTVAPAVDDVLDAGTRRLAASGFAARSAFLTSPTYGGISWLAHSTLQSGLWVDSQQRYADLMDSPRSTLSSTFRRAGWRTVGDVPANTTPWPQGRAFYGYDTLYDAGNVGYAGPRFGYPTMPDQYTLDAFHRLELARHPRRPVMAEIDLVTSHAPWSRTPRLVDPRRVGDGSVFDGMPEQAPSKSVIWRSQQRVRAAYGQAVGYSLKALIGFVRTYGDKDLVLVLLGDHQPASIVSGDRAGHDVPVTVVAHDPAVLDRIAGWGWQRGLRPRPDAPVWRMDAFRDRFLSAFGPAAGARPLRAGSH
jgi:phosphatidylglycerophosphate synthase